MFKRKKITEVEQPLTSMLDMAFQLLAFFIMTYNPMPIEGQFAMNLLPSNPQTEAEAPSESDQPNPDVPAELRTLTTSLYADPGGELGVVSVGDVQLQGIAQLEAKLKQILSDESLPFDQALIQADPELKYSELIRVVDVFMGLDMTKISFAELTDTGGPSL